MVFPERNISATRHGSLCSQSLTLNSAQISPGHFAKKTMSEQITLQWRWPYAVASQLPELRDNSQIASSSVTVETIYSTWVGEQDIYL